MSATLVLRWLNAPKNEVIPLHPDAPAHNYDDIHEERHPKLYFKIFKCGERIIKSHQQTNGSPAKMCKVAVDEEMSEGLILRVTATNTRI